MYPAKRRADGPDQIGDGGRRDAALATFDLAQNVVIDEQGEDDDDHDHEDRQNGVFKLQEGGCALPDRIADETHPLVALVLPQNAYGQVHGKQQPDDGRAYCYEDDFLHVVPPMKKPPLRGKTSCALPTSGSAVKVP